MKKIFTIFAIAASMMVVSCGKDNGSSTDNGSTKKTETEQGKEGEEEKKEGETTTTMGIVPILIDEATATKVQNYILADFRVDDTNNFLYVWEGTYEAGDGAGLNASGNADGYCDLVVTNVGWSGAGFFVSTTCPNIDKFIELTKLENTEFHISYKGKAGVPHLIIVNNNYKFCIGEGSFTDNGETFNAIKPTTGEFEANEWNEYVVKVKDMGLDFSSFPKGGSNSAGDNIVSFLSGGTQGTEIKLDKIYFINASGK